MTHVVSEACIGCRFSDCVTVCPVECFHIGPNFLVIDPEVCIDCALCIPECPVNAIFEQSALPAGQEEFLQLNAELSKQWPVLGAAVPHLSDAEAWRDVIDKRKHLVLTAPADE